MSARPAMDVAARVEGLADEPVDVRGTARPGVVEPQGGPVVDRPGAAVPDEELGQVRELRYGEVGGEGGLSAFFAYDSDSYVCGLDHADIVAAVADTGDALLGEGSDEEGDAGFLGGRAAAGDDCWELYRCRDEC